MKKTDYLKLVHTPVVLEDGFGWYFCRELESVIEIDSNNNTATLIAHLSDQQERSDAFAEIVMPHGHRLFLSSANMQEEQYIPIYDLKKHELKKLSLKTERYAKENHITALFSDVLLWNDSMYYYGIGYPAIVRLDLRDDTLSYIDDWCDELLPLINTDYGYVFNEGAAVLNEKIYFPCACFPGLVCYDLLTEKSSLLKIDADVGGLKNVTELDGRYLVMAGYGKNSNHLIIYDPVSKLIVKEIVLGEIGEGCANAIGDVLRVDDKLIVLPGNRFDRQLQDDYSIYEVSAMDFTARELSILEKWKNNIDTKKLELLHVECTKGLFANDGCVLFSTGRDFCWHEFDTGSGELEEYYIRLEDDKETIERRYYKYLDKLAKEGKIHKESETELEDFVKYIMH